MEKLNTIQKILFTIHSIVSILLVMFAPYLLFLGLFLYTGKIFYISLMPLWFGLDFYKHRTLTNLGYKMQISKYQLKQNPDKNGSDKIQE